MSHRENIARALAQANWRVSNNQFNLPPNGLRLSRLRGRIGFLPYDPGPFIWLGYMTAVLLTVISVKYLIMGVTVILLAQYVRYLNPDHELYFSLTLQEEPGRITVRAPGRHSRETQIVHEYCIAHGLAYRYAGAD